MSRPVRTACSTNRANASECPSRRRLRDSHNSFALRIVSSSRKTPHVTKKIKASAIPGLRKSTAKEANCERVNCEDCLVPQRPGLSSAYWQASVIRQPPHPIFESALPSVKTAWLFLQPLSEPESRCQPASSLLVSARPCQALAQAASNRSR